MEYLKQNSFVLKAAIFATGFAGIVAEYTLSTLATYFIGNSIFQWTMIVSLMLFCMGLGSRLSKLIKKNLIQNFLILEISLSLIVAFSSVLVYTLASVSDYYGFVIYSLSMLIGLLIGLEIPLVVRINKEYEDLKSNISSILEKDYYGSLIGGVFFAFIGLPILGLAYTPFVLGIINFLVALIVFYRFKEKINKRHVLRLKAILIVVFGLLITGISFTKPIIQWGEQKKYKDKVIYAEQTEYQKIVVTEWKNEHWLYLNGNLQFCSIDEKMYHEPLVHPIMQLHPNPQRILILGGGDGCAVREILKYPTVEKIDMVDLDPKMTDLGLNHPVLQKINKNSMKNDKLSIFNKDAYIHLEQNKADFYDIIIIDLPDPRNIELGRLYSHEFYSLCNRKLRPNGLIITQAGSPYFATNAYNCIDKTITSAGFNTVKLHNQVLSMGEWGWILGTKNKEISSAKLKDKLQKIEFKNVKTNWINNQAMQLITSFGKEFFNSKDSIEVNKVHNPVLYNYYLNGNWDLY
ncbi:polyamine aminopropyltransferase [Tenacibaculum finnmarkense genomovar ulcerans]|uniref:polyamine aminopropyltransferase n=1 Tax=Tenacibaculum finnmarkense TaxID=2781243 RepID=UPI00187B3B4A|nr:polyamine aminopropyltransferase [Tenacibaculum finnmarkense]MBE7687919.1 polyamine aminopropyltransferase [Tenacibaculum finnmarkense genomovar ulcerans]